jgi:23S rRNA-/tRNA-specific pseudouridylate synthase
VVHPSAGHYTGTLVHGLLYKCRNLSSFGHPTRPGIVHRLDKDTSGVMVVAKSDRAHEFLSNQFKKREIKKSYLTIVHGNVEKKPVVGDVVYGYGKRWWNQKSLIMKEALTLIRRQMLHAEILGFVHPDSSQYVEFEAPLPTDMNRFLEWLNKNQTA